MRPPVKPANSWGSTWPKAMRRSACATRRFTSSGTPRGVRPMATRSAARASWLVTRRRVAHSLPSSRPISASVAGRWAPTPMTTSTASLETPACASSCMTGPISAALGVARVASVVMITALRRPRASSRSGGAPAGFARAEASAVGRSTGGGSLGARWSTSWSRSRGEASSRAQSASRSASSSIVVLTRFQVSCPPRRSLSLAQSPWRSVPARWRGNVAFGAGSIVAVTVAFGAGPTVAWGIFACS